MNDQQPAAPVAEVGWYADSYRRRVGHIRGHVFLTIAWEWAATVSFTAEAWEDLGEYTTSHDAMAAVNRAIHYYRSRHHQQT